MSSTVHCTLSVPRASKTNSPRRTLTKQSPKGTARRLRRVKREDGLVSLVYLVCFVCLIEPDRPDQPSPVSRIPLVTRGYSAACYELVFRAVASLSTLLRSSPSADLSSPAESSPLQSCPLLRYRNSSGIWSGAAGAVHRNKADYLCPAKAPQAPSNGRSSFQPITRLLAFFPIFEASPHTCKTEENPTRSS